MYIYVTDENVKWGQYMNIWTSFMGRLELKLSLWPHSIWRTVSSYNPARKLSSAFSYSTYKHENPGQLDQQIHPDTPSPRG